MALKNKLIRILAVVMVLALGVSGIPAQPVFADEPEYTVPETQADDMVGEEVDQEPDAGESIADPVSDPAENLPEPAEADAAEETDENQEKLQYVYVESPYLESPDEQNIVVGWDNEVENMVLKYRDNFGNLFSVPYSEINDGGYLFKQSFTEADRGIYQLHSVEVTESGSTTEYEFAEFGVRAYFGVDEEYLGDDKSEHIELETDEVGEVEASVVTIGEDEAASETIVAESIADALDTALDSVTAAPAAAAAPTAAAASTKSNLVVVLDPGHDASHAGASGNGIQEHVAVLSIAKYCKAELELYGGVTVYLTRETAACPFPGTGSIEDINKRVAWAASKGADVFISFHLNSNTGSSPNGAEVYYTIGSSVGAGLSNQILNQLVGLGLNNHHWTKKPAEADYRVNTESGKYGFPGILIEHAFLSNASDASKFLKTEAGLKKLGVADATAIAKYYGLSKGYWEEVNGKWYYYENGKKVYGEKYINGNYYYLDPAKGGAKHEGWRTTSDATYYYWGDGTLAFGASYIGGSYYYFNPGNAKMHTGWRTDGSDTYYYFSNGKLAFKEQYIGGAYYYFNAGNAKMHKGWRTDGSDTYYYFSNGKIAFKEQYIGGAYYYFNAGNAKMHKGWRTDGSDTYYYFSNGKLAFKEQNISGSWYYFNAGNAKMHKGWRTDGGNTYYYNTSNGKISFGKTLISGKYYYFADNNAAMLRSTWKNGDYYGADGAMVVDETTLHSITGSSSTSAIQMERYFTSRGKIYPSAYKNSDAPTLAAFCQIYIEEAAAENIRAEVAYTQAMKETGWLTFTGSVSIDQYNFAGIGAVDNSAAGASFSTVREGIRAQIQHLKAYANTSALNKPCVDPRFHLVTRGVAPYVEWLGIPDNPNGKGWASAAGYGYDIIEMVKILTAQ